MKRLLLFLVILGAMLACKNESQNDKGKSVSGENETQEKRLKPSDERAVSIIDSVISKAGGERYETAEISFEFRDTTYISERNCGRFKLKRQFVRENGEKVTDIVTNTGFKRDVDGGEESLSEKKTEILTNKINSVHYFMQLPFGLNDPAVHKYYLGDSEIKGASYHKIKVQFKKEGGGEDHQDEYRYWVNDSTRTIDYLAYSYDTGEGGLRFRAAENPRTIEGIRFVDYKNYAPKSDSLILGDLEKAYKNDALELLSSIKNEDIEVELKDTDCD